MDKQKQIKERLIKAVNNFTDDIDDIAKEFDLSFAKLMKKSLDIMTVGFKLCAEFHKEEE
jgi:hypothetical protein